MKSLLDIFKPKKIELEQVFYNDSQVKEAYNYSIERLQRLNENLNEKKSFITWSTDSEGNDIWGYKYPEDIKLIQAEIDKENLKLDKLIEKYKIPNYAYMR